ncbi:hypothetical protein CHLRE_14g633600v5 [Chlamydomonas reinhardtii]|uniref:Uncharacterized protein n=1 Tax=Chlamydomonas reinhardtii TaxID=3055 RepID=A0A2K3CYW8_CHLRE|nr:uncharacterized protein CHLRE_14g633600v5 [Chlamydomonas reinhardtii]PNW73484.1 hypothetical protein CHLRE_14g633600v5 [Chlamydomonas reinhardtii]
MASAANQVLRNAALLHLRGTQVPVQAAARVGERWQPHELEVVISAVAAAAERARTAQGSATPGSPIPSARSTTMYLDFPHLMRQLGWDHTDARQVGRLRFKIFQTRMRLDNGHSAEEVLLMAGKRLKQRRDKSMKWLAWCRAALLKLPGCEGTSEDVCAVLQADPNMAQHLDPRVCDGTRAVPRWRQAVSGSIRYIPGLYKTGEKRGRRTVYRYDAQAGALLEAARRSKRRHAAGKGGASMQRLGTRR